MVRAVRKVKGTDLSKHTRARANSTSHAKIKGPSARARMGKAQTTISKKATPTLTTNSYIYIHNIQYIYIYIVPTVSPYTI